MTDTRGRRSCGALAGLTPLGVRSTLRASRWACSLARALRRITGQHEVVEVEVTSPDELGVAENLHVAGVGGLVRHLGGQPEDRLGPARVVEVRRRPIRRNREVERLAGLRILLCTGWTHPLRPE